MFGGRQAKICLPHSLLELLIQELNHDDDFYQFSKISFIRSRSRVGTAGECIAQVTAQEFRAGEPIGAVNEAGVRVPMSANVKVYGSFHFSESCTFDPERNLILAMNNGERGDGTENDGFVSLINPDGSVHTPKWIGVTRDGLELHHPLGSAVRNGVLYTVDVGYVRSLIWLRVNH